jgi:hypothetical protein
LQARRAGTLQLFAAGAARGSGVTLAFRAPRGRLDGARVPLAGGGAFAARATRVVHLVVDVVGYYD